ncbi:8-oxo-dGTP diphosphatase [Methanofervidicoccus abyssi]|uniref:8-oxo-dGTP diphosphatase n=2 Tax=Methanofervidicoccus abyssi TaxID=2082189 RepID=A0A401HQZ0_9EURY|nr:8-oxo-dGTP diphosphatase [Methanofervidicoccus abyssi]
MINMKRYKSPSLTVDGILEVGGKILLVKRKNPPFKDFWAFPGGFVNYGERTEEAVVREVFEESGIKTKVKDLLGVYSDPNRDPRGHTVSVVYVLEYIGGSPKGLDDAKEAKFFNIDEIEDMDLAFDHKTIFRDYLKFRDKRWQYGKVL